MSALYSIIWTLLQAFLIGFMFATIVTSWIHKSAVEDMFFSHSISNDKTLFIKIIQIFTPAIITLLCSLVLFVGTLYFYWEYKAFFLNESMAAVLNSTRISPIIIREFINVFIGWVSVSMILSWFLFYFIHLNMIIDNKIEIKIMKKYSIKITLFYIIAFLIISLPYIYFHVTNILIGF